MSAERPIRGRFGFRVAAPSFLIPADWETNVRDVGPLVDEVELLFFESAPPERLPGPGTVAALDRLGRESGVTFNIHLPTDLDPAGVDPSRRSRAHDLVSRLIADTALLCPTAYVLHLPCDGRDRQPQQRQRWRQRARGFVSDLLAARPGGIAASQLLVENTDYPPQWAWDAVADLGVGYCLDVGHLMLQGEDPTAVYDEYGENIRMIHLHGVSGGRDHRPLDRLSPSEGRIVAGMLRAFTGTLVIEVFSHGGFWRSVQWLCERFEMP